MKKYIKPTVKVRVIEMESLLAALSGDANYTGTKSFTVSPEKDEGNTEAGAKKSLFDNRWDGEE